MALGLSERDLCHGAHRPLIHHADVISIKGKSYRLREAELHLSADETDKPTKHRTTAT